MVSRNEFLNSPRNPDFILGRVLQCEKGVWLRYVSGWEGFTIFSFSVSTFLPFCMLWYFWNGWMEYVEISTWGVKSKFWYQSRFSRPLKPHNFIRGWKGTGAIMTTSKCRELSSCPTWIREDESELEPKKLSQNQIHLYGQKRLL